MPRSSKHLLIQEQEIVVVMYLLTRVNRAQLDTGAYSSMQRNFSALADAYDTAVTAMACAKNIVLRDNDGPAANAFRSKLDGDRSALSMLATHAAAARTTANAYEVTILEHNIAQVTMDAIAKQRQAALEHVAKNGDDLAKIAQLILQTRQDLKSVEGATTALIAAAWANLKMPESTVTQEKGDVDTEVASRWAELADEKRKVALQRMANEYADSHGIPRIQITFKPDDPGKFGYYRHGTGDSEAELAINQDYLSDPRVLHTVIHEMQHRRQYCGMDGQGMSPEEAERWKQLNQDHVRDKGKDPYPPRPVEVDARRAGRDFVNTLSLEDLERYI